MADQSSIETSQRETTPKIETASDLRRMYHDWLSSGNRKYGVDMMIEADGFRPTPNNPEDFKLREALRLIHFSHHLTELCFPIVKKGVDLRALLMDEKYAIGQHHPASSEAWVSIDRKYILEQKGGYDQSGTEFQFDDESLARILSLGVHEIAHHFNPKFTDDFDYSQVRAKYEQLRDEYTTLANQVTRNEATEAQLKVLEQEIGDALTRYWALPSEYMSLTWEKIAANRFWPWSKFTVIQDKLYRQVTGYKRERAREIRSKS